VSHVLEKLNFIDQSEPIDYEEIQELIAGGEFFVVFNRIVYFKGKRLGNVFAEEEWDPEDLEFYHKECAGTPYKKGE